MTALPPTPGNECRVGGSRLGSRIGLGTADLSSDCTSFSPPLQLPTQKQLHDPISTRKHGLVLGRHSPATNPRLVENTARTYRCSATPTSPPSANPSAIVPHVQARRSFPDGSGGSSGSTPLRPLLPLHHLLLGNGWLYGPEYQPFKLHVFESATNARPGPESDAAYAARNQLDS